MKELFLVLMLGVIWVGFAAFLTKIATKDKVTASTVSESQKKCPPHSWRYHTLRGIEGMNCSVCGFRAGTYNIERSDE